jgi:hypothetical protein
MMVVLAIGILIYFCYKLQRKDWDEDHNIEIDIAIKLAREGFCQHQLVLFTIPEVSDQPHPEPETTREEPQN